MSATKFVSDAFTRPLRPLSGLDLPDDVIEQTVAARGAPELLHPAPPPVMVPEPVHAAAPEPQPEAPAEVSAEVLAEAQAEAMPEALAWPSEAARPADQDVAPDDAPSPPEGLREGLPDSTAEAGRQDGAPESLAGDGVPLVDGLVPAGEGGTSAVAGDLQPEVPAKKKSRKREPVPGAPTPRHRWVRITVEMPDYVADQIRDKAHLARIPMRFAVMQAFRTARYKIADADMVEDHRKANGRPAAIRPARGGKAPKEDPVELLDAMPPPEEPKDEVLDEILGEEVFAEAVPSEAVASSESS